MNKQHQHTLRGLAAAVLAAVLAAGVSASQAAGYGSNLIVNPGAEDGVAGWQAFDGAALFEAVDYGPNWVQATQPGPVDRGARLFVGGGGQAYAAGWQTIDLAGNATAIAAGQVRYSLSGWLGGWTDQGDNPLLYVSFLDAAGLEVGHAQLGPVTPVLRGNTTGLFAFETAGSLPVATRQLMVSLSMERLSGGDNDGYADNLSLQISAVPEPQSWATLALGLFALSTLSLKASRRGRD